MRTGFWDIDRSFNDFERAFGNFDELRRWLDFNRRGGDSTRAATRTSSWPVANFYDHGSEITVKVLVPGMSEKDIQLNVSQDGVQLSGERKLTAPEGYAIQRQERQSLKFSRSFTFPVKVDPSKTSATLQNGVLTVTFTKLPELQPRTVEIKVG